MNKLWAILIFCILISCSINKGKSEGFVYTVKKGDNLYKIAQKYNTTVNDIKYYNDKYFNDLSIGEQLFIPNAGVTTVTKQKVSNKQQQKYPTEKDKHGIYYSVVRGDNLYRIGRNFKVSIATLKRVNNLNSDVLSVNDRIYIKVFDSKVVQTKKKKSKNKTKSQTTEYAKNSIGNVKQFPKKWIGEFELPVKGKISSPFGNRKGRLHKGVDISAPPGTNIKATYSGTVTYSAFLADYGNVIIIEHNDQVASVYAHNEINLVKLSDKVNKGDIIGKVGSTGRSTGPHLHFELRVENKPVDPADIVKEIKSLKKL